MTIIGVDPGMSGGIAVINGDYHTAIKMPETEKDIADYLDSIESKFDNYTKCYIEKIHTMPTTRPERIRCSCGRYHNTLKIVQGGASQGKFMQGYGFLRGVLIALGIPFDEVTPQKWQKEFVPTKLKTETKTMHKNKLKAKAQQLFPDLKVTLATSDALLIAQHGLKNA